MSVGDIQNIPCPFCQKTLYRLEFKQHNRTGDGQWINAEGSPVLAEDAKGKFIQCSHCLKLVAMEPDGVHPNPGFRIVPGQSSTAP